MGEHGLDKHGSIGTSQLGPEYGNMQKQLKFRPSGEGTHEPPFLQGGGLLGFVGHGDTIISQRVPVKSVSLQTQTKPNVKPEPREPGLLIIC